MLVRIAVLMKPQKVAYIKHLSLAGSYQAWTKGLHRREEISSSGSKNDEEERIVGSETLSTSSRELRDISRLRAVSLFLQI